MLTELKHLRVVVAAADEGSFSAAARVLNVDVSVVSRVVRDLELTIGISIFERLPRGVRLTEAGANYVDTARDILTRLHRADTLASLAAAGNVGRLSVGFVWSFSSGPVVDLLRSFSLAHPGVSVRTSEDGNDRLLTRLESRELDVVLAATDPPPLTRLKSIGHFRCMPLWLEPLCAAVPEAVAQESVTWTDLAGARLLCRPQDDWRRFVAHVERLGGPALQFTVHDVSSEGLMGLVAAGLGWLIYPASVASSRLPGVRVIPIVSDGAVLQVEAIWDGALGNPAVVRFIDLARQMFSRDQTKAVAYEQPQSRGRLP